MTFCECVALICISTNASGAAGTSAGAVLVSFLGWEVLHMDHIFFSDSGVALVDYCKLLPPATVGEVQPFL